MPCVRIISFLSVVLVTFFFPSSALADELYVRNQPFQGQVSGSGDAMTAELVPLARALGATVREVNGGWVVTLDPESQVGMDQAGPGQVVVEGMPVGVSLGADGKPMVGLRALAQPLGGTVKVNRELGTVDVYLTTAGAAPAQDWGDGGSSAAADTGTPSGVVLAYFGAVGQLPSIDNLAQLRDGGRLNRGFDTFNRRVKPLVTDEFYVQITGKLEQARQKLAAVAQLLAPLTNEQVEAELDKAPGSREMIAKALAVWNNVVNSQVKVLGEQVSGNTAVVQITMPNLETGSGEELGVVTLRREARGWKIVSREAAQ